MSFTGCILNFVYNEVKWKSGKRVLMNQCDRLARGWFGESILKKVGDGYDTLFWSDPWLGGSALCERFRRLFDLAENKGSVAEMTSLGWKTGGEVCPSSRDVYCVTGYPQKQTWSPEASYLLQLTFAFLDVERSSRPNTYSSPAVLLVLFGH
ncbi:hypothetical protein TSUD_366670 [Trifolium subterraneum]|uniref:Reverse transcriptase zinc-binding domain-containing protein n=1 Tax=Trifolium subterraneum TaxID=3900 RepID=A0A2Z6LLQ1_TRISU|nr:hypothetical protein TSUD_366670 [Trifolium subterraneum]